jgi:hypothetical protein
MSAPANPGDAWFRRDRMAGMHSVVVDQHASHCDELQARDSRGGRKVYVTEMDRRMAIISLWCTAL